MDLSGLLPHVRRAVAPGRAGSARQVVLEEAKAPAIAALVGEAPVLVITATRARAVSLADQLTAWLGDHAEVLVFPEPDVLPYERIAPDPRLLRERLRTLHHLQAAHQQGRPLVLVASAAAVAIPTVSPDAFHAATLTVKEKGKAPWAEFGDRLVRAGYEPVTTVEAPGQFARRGGIIDVFSPQMEMPVRIDLFGDEVDNIRTFDVANQRSTDVVTSATIIPARELLGKPWVRPPALALEGCTPEAAARITEDLRRLSAGETLADGWLYASLFNTASLLDHLSKQSVVILDEPRDIEMALSDLAKEADELRQELITAGELPRVFPDALVPWERLQSGAQVTLHRWGGEEEESLPFEPVTGYGGRFRPLLGDVERLVQSGVAVALVSLQSQRLTELLEEADIVVRAVDGVSAPPTGGSVALIHGSLPGGWALPASGEGTAALPALTVLTDAELFGFVKEQRKRGRRAVKRENPMQGISPGDYVVHIEHGIARFVGAITMQEDGGHEAREYLHLVYSGGAKLYVPSDQLDRISRYIGPGDHAPQLSSLGTQEWERAKARVKQNAMAQARELLDTAAARQVKQGIEYPADTPWQQELEGSFPYVETPDQLQAVYDVKADMEKLQPMDRLICGDVGYGKTEVAVRAAFKAMQGGRQVAVLVPTTVLAQQHYATFSQRLSAFPVKVEVLSRFRSDQEAQQVLAGLADGSVDIVIGTHRLLQKGVQFKNLGLAIIDEEQRFGVMHKEYFKRLRHEIDVLTLTATPIPRTLYMAMAGVRDMSVIDTPPEERLPVKTYVNDFDEPTIRHAILRELERGGQVFFVHNRVQNIAHIVRQLADLVPEATFAMGHGQMHEDGLEQVMVEFSEGRCDVLVCTTIIESGLDLPNVNTIIINDADKLGLAQLYQLRGRVGRGSSRAYAYLLYPRNKAITERAQRRLQAVFEANEAGAGYFIAMKDLEIRGAGNLLGTEQSGHVGAVGFDLYCRILASAVEDVKAEREGLPMPSTMPQAPAVSLDLRLPAYLPEDYVPGLDERLDIYRRMASAIETDAIDEMEQELYDRFGPLPHAVEHLLYAVRVKLLATRAGAATVQREGDDMVVRLLEGLQIPSGKLAGLTGVTPGRTLLRIDARGAPNRWQARLEQALERLAG